MSDNAQWARLTAALKRFWDGWSWLVGGLIVAVLALPLTGWYGESRYDSGFANGRDQLHKEVRESIRQDIVAKELPKLVDAQVAVAVQQIRGDLAICTTQKANLEQQLGESAQTLREKEHRLRQLEGIKTAFLACSERANGLDRRIAELERQKQVRLAEQILNESYERLRHIERRLGELAGSKTLGRSFHL